MSEPNPIRPNGAKRTLSRRDFLRVGTTTALAGLVAACAPAPPPPVPQATATPATPPTALTLPTVTLPTVPAVAETVSVKSVHVEWDKVKCSNCLSCAVVCAERHGGVSAPSRARIWLSVDALNDECEAEYCRQCSNPYCAPACPQGAIKFDAQVRAWRVDEKLCQGCGRCVEACPFSAIRLQRTTGRAAKCDLCLGAARCVEVCPTKALTIQES